MPLACFGSIGVLPATVWATLLGVCLQPVGPHDTGRRRTVLALRRVCRALAVLVAECNSGGAGKLTVRKVEDVTALLAHDTMPLGRSLLVRVWLQNSAPMTLQRRIVDALAAAVARGHTIVFKGPNAGCVGPIARAVEAALVEASDEGLLEHAALLGGDKDGWSVAAMSQFATLDLSAPERGLLAEIVAGGRLRSVSVDRAPWSDSGLVVLSGLDDVTLWDCDAVEDLSPLAKVPRLAVRYCHGLKALPPMQNTWLEIASCRRLADVSGLASGRVRHLRMDNLPAVRDTAPVAAMRPPPQTLVLNV